MELAGDFLVQVEVRMMNLQSFKVPERLCGLCGLGLVAVTGGCVEVLKVGSFMFFQMDLSPRSPEQGATVC